jgi:hypothetical protein
MKRSVAMIGMTSLRDDASAFVPLTAKTTDLYASLAESRGGRHETDRPAEGPARSSTLRTAVAAGFEPAEGVNPHTLSRRAP